MQNIRLTIVIAVHNRKNTTLQCLQQLARQTFQDFSIIVVDDGSADGTSAAIRQFFPSVTVINGTGNWWWTRSVNEGIRYALDQHASHVLLLNDDTYFTSDYLAQVNSEITLNPESVIGSLNLTSEKPHRVYFSGASKLNTLLFRYERYHKTFSLYQDDEKVSRFPSVYLPARGALIPATVFSTIGLLDEVRFPQYASDVEFTLNAHETGFDMYVCSGLKIFTPVDSTGSGDIYKKESFFKFLSSFGNKYAKRHLFTNLQLIRNHVPGYLAPFSFLIYNGSILAKYFVHKVKSQG
jgi:GT2 family glycosyltransferase